MKNKTISFSDHIPADAENESFGQVVANGDPVPVPLLVGLGLAANVQHLVDLFDVSGQSVAPGLNDVGLGFDLVVLDGAKDVRFVLLKLVDLQERQTLHVGDDVVDQTVDSLVLQNVPGQGK